MEHEIQVNLAKRFHALHHQPEMLILRNAWDAGSAMLFEKAGFDAIGTTSAGIAYTLGYPDGQRIGLPEVIDVERKMIRRIQVPLTVDIESGYGDTPQQVAETVRQVIQEGAVGINLEDSQPGTDSALLSLDEQAARVRAIAALKTELGILFFINARTDIFWLAIGDAEKRLSAAVERCRAYTEAGADGIFVPGQLEHATIRELINEIDAPLNILAMPANPTIPELQALRVARLSLGSGPARAVLGLVQKIAAELHEKGLLSSMTEIATPYHDMNALFE
jgi:2-methylisocitrate lyase-like PEP mutase family enzyme